MKKAFFLLLLYSAVLFGCEEKGANMYGFDYTDIALEVRNFSYDVKLPKSLPFGDIEAHTTVLPNGDEADVELTSPNGNTFVIQIRKDPIEYDGSIEYEEVEVEEDVKGLYYKDYNGKVKTAWQEDGIYYDITYHPIESRDEINKYGIVNMAGSFQ
jgi:hypothetical protein